MEENDKPDMTCAKCGEESCHLVKVRTKREHSFAADTYGTYYICLKCLTELQTDLRTQEDNDEQR